MPKIISASEEAVVLTVDQFCTRYAVGRDFFYAEVKRGGLAVHKIGMRTLVAKGEAERWFRSKEVRHADA